MVDDEYFLIIHTNLALHGLPSDNEITIIGSFYNQKTIELQDPSSVCYHLEIKMPLVSCHEPCNLIG